MKKSVLLSAVIMLPLSTLGPNIFAQMRPAAQNTITFVNTNDKPVWLAMHSEWRGQRGNVRMLTNMSKTIGWYKIEPGKERVMPRQGSNGDSKDWFRVQLDGEEIIFNLPSDKFLYSNKRFEINENQLPTTVSGVRAVPPGCKLGNFYRVPNGNPRIMIHVDQLTDNGK